MYGLTFVGKHGEAFWRSSLCYLPPHRTATLRPCRGRIRKSPPCRYHMRLQSSVPLHLIRKAGCHRVFAKKILRGLSMVHLVLLCKHLRTIPSILIFPDATASVCNRPRWDHLQHTTTCHLPRPAQPYRAVPFGDWRLRPFTLPKEETGTPNWRHGSSTNHRDPEKIPSTQSENITKARLPHLVTAGIHTPGCKLYPMIPGPKIALY